MVRWKLLFILCLVICMAGCGHNMALTKGQTSIDVTTSSIALLSVKISNQNKPKYQLDIMGALICPQSERCGHGSVSGFHKTRIANRINSVENSYNEYLLSFELESGPYNFHSIGAAYSHFPITGGGSVPMNYTVDIKPHSVIYLGHLDIVLRERKTDREVRAGSVIPLIDQALVGASSGTFDVIAEDKYEEDMKLFIAEYPALQNVRVEKSVLPPWIRPENLPAN
jgi:hypothetical protein